MVFSLLMLLSDAVWWCEFMFFTVIYYARMRKARAFAVETFPQSGSNPMVRLVIVFMKKVEIVTSSSLTT